MSSPQCPQSGVFLTALLLLLLFLGPGQAQRVKIPDLPSCEGKSGSKKIYKILSPMFKQIGQKHKLEEPYAKRAFSQSVRWSFFPCEKILLVGNINASILMI